jgi:hypothetical protein
MSLVKIGFKWYRYSDKRDHSYLPLYESLLYNKKETAKNIIEVGIGCNWYINYNKRWCGGSTAIWHDYFTNANIYSLDIHSTDKVILPEYLRNNEKIHFMIQDAYDEDIFNNTILNKNIKFDFILDDGDHKLSSMKKFIKLYSKILSDDGVLIIEDITNINWLDELKNITPNNLIKFVETYETIYSCNFKTGISPPPDGKVWKNYVFVINKNTEIESNKILKQNNDEYTFDGIKRVYPWKRLS